MPLRPAKFLRYETGSALNFPGDRLGSAGKMNNNANIGKSTEEIADMWNEAHPEEQPFQAARFAARK